MRRQAVQRIRAGPIGHVFPKGWSPVGPTDIIIAVMKCDLCDNSAVVHETTVKNGIKNEVHLCEEHAAEAGISLPGQQPISQLLTQYVICKSGSSRGRTSQKTCPTCGLSLRSFRRKGQLGCPGCYEAFEEQLTPMIERAQNGGTSHIGKCPSRGGASMERQLNIQRLFRELEDAVAAEQYERAAELRDRLRDLDPKVAAPKPARRSARAAD